MFSKWVCWDASRAHIVLNIEAEKVRDSVFMATHSSYPIRRMSVDPGVRTEWAVAPRHMQEPGAFLDEFLSPDRLHAQAVVLGGVGSGKSHFIQWMRLNISPGDAWHVVTVPRAGTSLRGILDQLIEILPADVQDDHRRRLRDAPVSSLTPDRLEKEIIDALALAVGDYDPEDEIDEALQVGLKDFLDDPAMRDFHVGTGGIVSELARHTAQPTGHEARQARRQFTLDDLHLAESTPRLRDFSAPTRRFLQQLIGNQALRERSVQIINASLEPAIGRVLGFTGDQLIGLLREIRRFLGREGKELILLFEDFARAEGIDRALLDGLMERTDGSPGSLCPLRWAMAVTWGYYDQVLLDTHKARMDFLIDMDLRRGESTAMDDGEFLRFTARYLNALRVPEASLDAWYGSWRKDPDGPPPNACTTCEFKDDCHAAFGTAALDSAVPVGLYPFTRDSLMNLANRRGMDETFNPRTLLDRVLRPVLEAPRAADLKDGRFPDTPLVEQFGGRRLPPAVQAAIRQRHPQAEGRYRAVLELWTASPQRPAQLPDALYEAFGLEPLAIPLDRPIVDQPEPRATAEEAPRETSPQSPRIQQIRAWHNGANLPQALARDLRAWLFEAIDGYTDWDTAGLARSTFASTQPPAMFRPASIRLRRQETSPPSPGIQFEIPLLDSEDDWERTALALEGLIEYRERDTWEYPDGGTHLLALSRCLENWSDRALMELRRVADPEESWDPVASAVEVLAIGAALASKPPGLDATAVERLDSLLGDWPNPDELGTRSSEWTSLYRDIYRRKDLLTNIVRAHSSASKGGAAGNFVDAARLIVPLRRLASDWRPRAVPPERLMEAGIRDPYGSVLSLHHIVCSQLPSAISAELERRRQWLARMRQWMPLGTKRAEVVGATRALLQAVLGAGLAVPADQVRRLEDQLSTFGSVQVDEATRMAQELADVTESMAVLPRVAGERRATAIEAADSFFAAAGRFLDVVDSVLRSEELRTTGGGQLARDYERIDGAFREIERTLILMAATRDA